VLSSRRGLCSISVGCTHQSPSPHNGAAAGDGEGPWHLWFAETAPARSGSVPPLLKLPCLLCSSAKGPCIPPILPRNRGGQDSSPLPRRRRRGGSLPITPTRGDKEETSQDSVSPPETDPAGGASRPAERGKSAAMVFGEMSHRTLRLTGGLIGWFQASSLVTQSSAVSAPGLWANGVSPSWNIGQVQVQRTRFPWKSTLLRPLSWTSALQHDFLEVSLSAAFQEPSFHAAVLASNKVLGT